MDVFNQLVGLPDAQQPGNNGDVWLPRQRTKGITDESRLTPGVYIVGMGLMDGGSNHVHITRNESNLVARTITVELIPAVGARPDWRSKCEAALEAVSSS